MAVEKKTFSIGNTHTHTSSPSWSDFSIACHLSFPGGVHYFASIWVLNQKSGWENPQIIPFVHRVWNHEINKPSILGGLFYPIFGSTSHRFSELYDDFVEIPSSDHPTSVATSRLSAFLSGCHLRQLNLG